MNKNLYLNSKSILNDITNKKQNNIKNKVISKKPISKKITNKSIAKKPISKKITNKSIAKMPISTKKIINKSIAKMPISTKKITNKSIAKMPISKKIITNKSISNKSITKIPISKKIMSNTKISIKNTIKIDNLVSVIVPSYNCEKYIIDTIKSVVNQTYKNWELIIIDDASPDNTYNIVSKYIEDNKLNDKIKLIKNHKNMGCYISFNIGLIQSIGEYICILGSDDTYHIDKLKIQTEILDNDQKLVATIAHFKRGKKIVKRKNMTTCTIMFRKKIVNKIGYFDSVRYGADDEFMHRILTVYGEQKIKTVHKVLYNAVIREGSLTRSKKTGLNSQNRRDYWNKVLLWHMKNIVNLYIPYPLKKRPFNVDKLMINN